MAVCDMTKFPRTKYFQQHELPEFGPEGYDYEYTRRLIIRTEAETNTRAGPGEIKTLNTIMTEIENDGGLPGVEKTKAGWEDLLLELFFKGRKIYDFGVPPGRRTPFDFVLWRKSRIVIRLSGGFWRFSSTMASITTKYQYGSQYFDLRRHFVVDKVLKTVTEAEWEHRWKGYDCRCISFFCQEPCLEEFWVSHAFSLNVDLLMQVKQPDNTIIPMTLPITIDPDVENKGGNPGP